MCGLICSFPQFDGLLHHFLCNHTSQGKTPVYGCETRQIKPGILLYLQAQRERERVYTTYQAAQSHLELTPTAFWPHSGPHALHTMGKGWGLALLPHGDTSTSFTELKQALLWQFNHWLRTSQLLHHSWLQGAPPSWLTLQPELFLCPGTSASTWLRYFLMHMHQHARSSPDFLSQ